MIIKHKMGTLGIRTGVSKNTRENPRFTVKILSAFRLLLKNRFHYSETNCNLQFEFRNLNGILKSSDCSLSPTSFEIPNIDWFIVVIGEIWRHLPFTLFHIARDDSSRVLR